MNNNKTISFQVQTLEGVPPISTEKFISMIMNGEVKLTPEQINDCKAQASVQVN